MNAYWSNTINLMIQVFIAFGGTAGIVGLVVFAFKNTLAAWISRQFLDQNTRIIEGARQEFTHALESHRADLTRSLDEYRSGLNKSLEEYKTRLSGDLASQVEPLKASLSRENIGFQIAHTEYIKRQFLRIEELFSALLDLQRFIIKTHGVTGDVGEVELYSTQKETYEKMQDTSDKLLAASFFLPESSGMEVFSYLDKIYALIKSREEYWLAFQLLKNSHPDSQNSQEIIIDTQSKGNHYDSQHRQVGTQFRLISESLRTLLSTSLQK